MVHEKFTQGNSVEMARAMNKVATARHRNKLVSSTTNQIIKQLYEVTGDPSVKIVHTNTEALCGDIVFDGLMKITATVKDKGYVKTIDIPVQIVKSSAIFPSSIIIKHKLESIVVKNTRGFNATQRMVSELKRIARNEKYVELQAKGSKFPKIAVSIQDGEAWVRRTIEGFEYEYDTKVQEILKTDAPVDSKVAGIKERIAEIVLNSSDDEGTQIKSVDWSAIKFDDTELVDLIEKSDEIKTLKKEESPKQASVEVKAKEIEIPSVGVDNMPENRISETMLVSVVNLPDSTEEGDVINFSGRKYKVTKTVDNFGRTDTSNWLLVLEK